MSDAARAVMERIAALARISEHPDYLMRRSYTGAMREANALVATWMERAGMTVRLDHIGNLIGRYPTTVPDGPSVIFGSHLDTVRDAGAFDGPLGILLALAVVEQLRANGTHLPFHLDMLCFADEEGVRWGTAYLGSKAVAGTFDRECFDRRDADGISLRDAMRAFGANPDRIADDVWTRTAVLGYCEAHIEQGPVLEAHDLAVGIVGAISGQSRWRLRFEGVAGHAGTVPMALRHDALAAAAAFVVAVEAYAQAAPGLVATVGELRVEPGASNVIPGQVSLSLDVRHADDDVRLRACEMLRQQSEAESQRRGVTVRWEVVQEIEAIQCDDMLTGVLTRAVADNGYEPYMLASGAGHDAVAMAALAPVAMLFVRCEGGISHNPAESVEERDVAAALAVLHRFVTLLAAHYAAHEEARHEHV
jgi:allantoate deiminase